MSSKSLPPEPMVVMGRLGAPFGVRGWVKVHAFTSQPAALLDYRRWWTAAGADEDENVAWRELVVAETRLHAKGLVVRPEGCADRTQALGFRGMPIAVPRSELPQAGHGEYYWTDLIGLEVVNRDGMGFGTVAELMATGANDVLVVRGDRERLIPFIDGVVVEVDLEARRVTVEWGADF